MKEISLFDLRGDINIGLYCRRIGESLLCGLELKDGTRERIERLLGLRVVTSTVAGTPFPGIFLLDAGDRIIAPHIIYDTEREALLKAGFNVEVWNAFDTALANAVCLDGDKAIISTAAHASLREALAASEFDILELDLGEYESPGSVIIPAESVLVGDAIPSEAQAAIGEFLGKQIVPTSVNRGSPFLASGIVWSDQGVLIGKESLPAEVMTITEVLG